MITTHKTERCDRVGSIPSWYSEGARFKSRSWDRLSPDYSLHIASVDAAVRNSYLPCIKFVGHNRKISHRRHVCNSWCNKTIFYTSFVICLWYISIPNLTCFAPVVLHLPLSNRNSFHTVAIFLLAFLQHNFRSKGCIFSKIYFTSYKNSILNGTWVVPTSKVRSSAVPLLVIV
jgi:hypothetical protein